MADDDREMSNEEPGTSAEEVDTSAEEVGESAGESRRPISVRDLLPSPPERPEPRSRDGEASGEAEGRAEAEAEGEDGVDVDIDVDVEDDVDVDADVEGDAPSTPSVPTPVRVAMDAEDPGAAGRRPEDLPSRRVEIDGRAWIVRVTGRTLTGTHPDAGALLMRLGFYPAPEDGDSPGPAVRPERVLLTVDRSIEVLYDEDLEELFRRSRPVPDEGSVSI